MKILSLYENLLKDSYFITQTHYNPRDLERIKSRFESEGISFLTLTLPKFCDDIFLSLEAGYVAPTAFLGFSKRRGIPVFLGDFLRKIFNETSLEVKRCINVKALDALRQICFAYKKVELQCTKHRTKQAFEDYVNIDDAIVSPPIDNFYDEVAAVLWSSVFDSSIEYDALIPHDGPGSTAEGFYGNAKHSYDKKVSVPERILEFYSEGSLVDLNDEIYHESHRNVEIIRDFMYDEPVNVIGVPKTLKGPRIIATEPLLVQRAQQGLKDYLVEKIESAPLTQGHINFSDQSINKFLALNASSSRYYATLDLSSASDRVSNELVIRTFISNPSLCDCLQAVRSRWAYVKELNRVLLLNKYASMGSATCFPVESAVFFTICTAAILKYKHLKPTYKNIKMVTNEVYVYGDDIIIPTEVFEYVKMELSKFGNSVNSKKSYCYSSFRESCGCDAYNGVDITPVYVRVPLDSYSKSKKKYQILNKKNHNKNTKEKDQAIEIISLVATANMFADKNYFYTANMIKHHVEDMAKFKFPTNNVDEQGLSWSFATINDEKIRWNNALQREEVLTLVPVVKYIFDPLDNASCYAKYVKRFPRKGEDIFSTSSQSIRDTRKNQTYKEGNSRYAITKRMATLTSKCVDELEFTAKRGGIRLKKSWVSKNLYI